MATGGIEDRAKARAFIRDRIASGESVSVEQIVWAFGVSGFARIAKLAEANGVLVAGSASERPARDAVLRVFDPGVTVAAGQAVRRWADPRGRLIHESVYVACDDTRLAWAGIKAPGAVSQRRLAAVRLCVEEEDRLILHVSDPATMGQDTIVFRFWSDAVREAIRARMTPSRPDTR